MRPHRRVAFPLPGVPLTLRWSRPKAYPENPRSLGEHLLKRRSEQGFTQREAAAQVGIKTDTYLLWEKDRTKPTVRYYPAIFAFLGYDPLPVPSTLAARIGRKRQELGLSIDQAAKLLGVDEGTFRRWERGEWKPRLSSEIVDQFLAMRP
jgi:transcriptional regulator with XRE-family HTH domain